MPENSGVGAWWLRVAEWILQVSKGGIERRRGVRGACPPGFGLTMSFVPVVMAYGAAPVEVHRSSPTEQPRRSKRLRFHGDICQEIADHGTEVTCATSAKTSRVLDERGVRGACPRPFAGRRATHMEKRGAAAQITCFSPVKGPID